MAMVVRNNLMAYNANRQLGMNTSAVSKNIEKLSSGFKINRAADDAAGLAVSEKMKAQIKGLEQASANSQDGISLVQTAEGALTEVHDMLNRMTELATKSANGTISDAVDREAIQNEVNKLNAEIDRISSSTNFNGINLLDGSLSSTGKTSSAVSNFKMEGLDAALTDVAATKGKYTSSTLSIAFSANATGGEKFSYTVGTADGKSVSVELKYDKDTNSLIGSNGKVYKTGLTAGKVSTGNLSDAFAAALKDTDLAKNYNITSVAADGEVVFEAKEAGANIPKITSLGHSTVSSTGAATSVAMSITTDVEAKDAYQKIDVTKITKFGNGSNTTTTDAEKAVFTINGKKFAVAGSDAAAADLAKFDSDVTVIRLVNSKSDAAVATASDAVVITAAINQKLGIELAVPASNASTIELVDTAAPSAGDATGGLTLQIGDTGETFNQVTVSVQDMSSKGIKTNELDVSTQETAKASIQTIKDAINQVSTNRGELGALQNRLEHAINNLDVSAENMTSANSRIRDTDMAKQMMEYTKMNVLQQSAQAMLATANQAPQSILQLLQ